MKDFDLLTGFKESARRKTNEELRRLQHARKKQELQQQTIINKIKQYGTLRTATILRKS